MVLWVQLQVDIPLLIGVTKFQQAAELLLMSTTDSQIQCHATFHGGSSWLVSVHAQEDIQVILTASPRL